MESIIKFENTLRIAAHNAFDLWLYGVSREGRRAWQREVTRARRTFSAFSVARGGGRHPYWFTKQDASTKLEHNEAFTSEWEEIVHYGAPARTSGVLNMCPASTPGCRKSCLHTSGQLGMPNQNRATIIRTQFMHAEPYLSRVIVLAELEANAKRIERKGRKMVVRQNGTTDEALERVWPPSFFRIYFHQDYTKRVDRLTDDRVAERGYYLVASATERTNVAAMDGNVVVPVHVRRGAPLPDTFDGKPVVDGDVHDLRFLDPQGGYAVLVRAKGKAISDTTGFTRQVPALVGA